MREFQDCDRVRISHHSPSDCQLSIVIGRYRSTRCVSQVRLPPGVQRVRRQRVQGFVKNTVQPRGRNAWTNDLCVSACGINLIEVEAITRVDNVNP